MTADPVTQFCIEEAVLERLETVEKTAQRAIAAATGAGPEWDGTGDPPGITQSPGERQQLEHAARMRELTGGDL